MGQAVQLIPGGAPLGLERSKQRGGNHGRGDPILVTRSGGIRAKADGLLVAESQLRGARDPLEARERRVVFEPVRAGDARQQARGHDRVCERSPQAARGQELAQQAANLVAAQRGPFSLGVWVGHRERAAVRVGVDRDDQVGVLCPGLLDRHVEGAGLLGVREGHGREVGVGLGLRGDERDLREAGLGQHARGHRGAHAMHGGQDDTQVRAGGLVAGGERDGFRDVLFARIHSLDQVIVHGDLVGGGRSLDGRGDLGVEGRDDLDALPVAGDDAATQVDLVAVVRGGVVRGGHHDARVRAVVAHREGGQRGRVGLGQREDAHAGGGGDAAGGRGELGGAVAGVAAHDQGGGARRVGLDDLAQAGGRADDDGQVHAGLTGADDTAQAGRAELEGAVHGRAHAGERLLVAALRGLDVGLQGRGRGRVRVVVGPALSLVK